MNSEGLQDKRTLALPNTTTYATNTTAATTIITTITIDRFQVNMLEDK